MAGGDERDWRELIASSDRHAAHAQRYLERATPHLDPMFDLPWAVRRRVATAPEVELTSRHRCGSQACLQVADNLEVAAIAYGRGVVICALRAGHPGAHMTAADRQSFDGWWSITSWEPTAPAAKDDPG